MGAHTIIHETWPVLLQVGTDPRGWMEWLATHHEFYTVIILHHNCFQIQSQQCRFSKLSWRHAPRLHAS